MDKSDLNIDLSPLAEESWNKEVSYNNLIDIDGNSYKTIQIGEQEWMAENLRVSHYNNGDEIRNIDNQFIWQTIDYGALCYYDNNDSLFQIYGGLYNHLTIEDQRNVCPAGWKIPTVEDYNLFKFNIQKYIETAEGLSEKQILNAFVDWDKANKGKDVVGFRALPAGHRNFDGNFFSNGLSANFWLSNSFNNGTASAFGVHYKTEQIIDNVLNKEYGLSIRCVKSIEK